MKKTTLIAITIVTCISIVALIPFALATTTTDVIQVARFSEMDLEDWTSKSFSGNTEYSITKKDGRHVLSANADMSASALYKRIEVDLEQTPYLNWSWQVESTLTPLREKTKQGDDYAARIYVIVKRGALPWKTYALNYVWSSNPQKLGSWPNAYVANAVMIPKRSSVDAKQTWFKEKVNVREDFKKYLGFDIDKINGIAVMTDTDNSRLFAAANYGDIYFSKN